jgi:hypothetical protein
MQEGQKELLGSGSLDILIPLATICCWEDLIYKYPLKAFVPIKS